MKKKTSKTKAKPQYWPSVAPVNSWVAHSCALAILGEFLHLHLDQFNAMCDGQGDSDSELFRRARHHASRLNAVLRRIVGWHSSTYSMTEEQYHKRLRAVFETNDYMQLERLADIQKHWAFMGEVRQGEEVKK